MDGICHICGRQGKLTFEHVPPRSAFNDKQVVYHQIEKLFNKSLEDLGKGKISQKGMGAYTLCGDCNNKTGGWYGGAFSEFAFQGMDILKHTSGSPTLYYNFNIFPLRVFKQIICLFFSSNGPEFHTTHYGLVKYVLNKEETYFDSDVRIFLYYNLSNRFRKTGVTVTANLRGKMDVMSEITFPPFGFVMSLNNTVPDKRLTEITFLKNYTYNQWTQIPLKLYILPVYTYIPGDYRTKEEVDADVARNKKYKN